MAQSSPMTLVRSGSRRRASVPAEPSLEDLRDEVAALRADLPTLFPFQVSDVCELQEWISPLDAIDWRPVTATPLVPLVPRAPPNSGNAAAEDVMPVASGRHLCPAPDCAKRFRTAATAQAHYEMAHCKPPSLAWESVALPFSTAPTAPAAPSLPAPAKRGRSSLALPRSPVTRRTSQSGPPSPMPAPRRPSQPSPHRLPASLASLFGQLPMSDPLVLVTCRRCYARVTPQGLELHCKSCAPPPATPQKHADHVEHTVHAELGDCGRDNAAVCGDVFVDSRLRAWGAASALPRPPPPPRTRSPTPPPKRLPGGGVMIHKVGSAVQVSRHSRRFSHFAGTHGVVIKCPTGGRGDTWYILRLSGVPQANRDISVRARDFLVCKPGTNHSGVMLETN